MDSRRSFLRRLSGVCLAFPISWEEVREERLTRSAACLPTGARQMRWIVPNAPGGGADTYVRILQPFLERRLGLTLRVDNISGASGIVGARVLRDARPDGLTLGILNAPGLLVAFLSGVSGCPDPLEDFQILCRVARSRHVWVTGPGSGLTSFEDLLDVARRRPLVFGLNNVGGVSFIDAALVSHLLGIEVAYVPGFRGSRETSLAAARGDVDLVAFSLESILDRVEAGYLKPLLQIAEDPDPSEPWLAGVPVLGGSMGVVARLYSGEAAGRDRALEDAGALIRLIGAGRVVAAPRKVPEATLRCLEERLLAALEDPGYRAATRRNTRMLDIASGREAREEILSVGEAAGRFIPVIQTALARVRRNQARDFRGRPSWT